MNSSSSYFVSSTVRFDATNKVLCSWIASALFVPQKGDDVVTNVRRLRWTKIHFFFHFCEHLNLIKKNHENYEFHSFNSFDGAQNYDSFWKYTIIFLISFHFTFLYSPFHLHLDSHSVERKKINRWQNNMVWHPD